MVWTAPRTWAVGDPATAADMNTYIRDNIAFLYGNDTPVPLALAGGITNYGGGFAGAQVERHGSIAQLSGVLSVGTAVAPGGLIAVVPVGWCPIETQLVICNVAGVIGGLNVLANGQVICGPGAAVGNLISITNSYSLIS